MSAIQLEMFLQPISGIVRCELSVENHKCFSIAYFVGYVLSSSSLRALEINSVHRPSCIRILLCAPVHRLWVGPSRKVSNNVCNSVCFRLKLITDQKCDFLIQRTSRNGPCLKMSKSGPHKTKLLPPCTGKKSSPDMMLLVHCN